MSTDTKAHLYRNTAVAIMIAFGALAVAGCGEQQSAAPAQDTAELVERGFVPIFNGVSLDGWDVKPGHEGHWVARSGIIDYDGKAECKSRADRDLWTIQEYGDFILHVEWRLPATPTMKPHPIVLPNGDFVFQENGKRETVSRLDAGDSGVYVRGSMKAQLNIWSQLLGSGEINGYRVDKSLPDELRKEYIPTTRADRPFGEWNRFLITVRGEKLTTVLNGETVLENVRLPGMPARGAIGLQHHGDRVQFRNLMVKRLDEKSR